MKAPETPPIVVGRASRAEICGDGSSVILWVGGVSLRMDVTVARDVASTLACSLIRCTEAARTARAKLTGAAGGDDAPPNQPDERRDEWRDEWDVPTLTEPSGHEGAS